MPDVTGNWDNMPDDNYSYRASNPPIVKRKPRKPRLVLTDDWGGIAKELRKQLKPFGLTVRTRTHREWGDMVDWEVRKI